MEAEEAERKRREAEAAATNRGTDGLVIDGTKVTGYTGAETSVIIPNGITEIAENAFEKSGIISISLPDSLTKIGAKAFSECSSLSSIAIPSSCFDFGAYAFKKCKNLKIVYLPETLQSIPDYAFDSCRTLENIQIPDNVTGIGKYAFRNCTKMKEFSFPKGVTEIGVGAFTACRHLEHIELPNSLTELEYGTFRDCVGLKKLILHKGLTQIGYDTFKGCSALTEVVFPEGLTRLGSSAFSGCSALSKVVLPEGLTELGSFAFSGCSALSKVVLPEGLTELGDHAFSKCTRLAEVVFPGSLKKINQSMIFYKTPIQCIVIHEGCLELDYISFPETVKDLYIPASVQKISAYFNELKNAVVHVPRGSFAESFMKKKYFYIKIDNKLAPAAKTPPTNKTKQDITANSNVVFTAPISSTNTIYYTVRYIPNGGYGCPSVQTKKHGEMLQLSSGRPMREGYTFQGWSTSSDARQVRYYPGSAYYINEDITLYAVWRSNSSAQPGNNKVYTVRYNLNGGQGNFPAQTKKHGEVLLLSKSQPIRPGYYFRGWGESQSSQLVDYYPGTAYIANKDVTLYALWKSNPQNPYAFASPSSSTPNNTNSYTPTTSSTYKPTHLATSQKQSEGCYIATAVYGSYSAPEVITLRRFRDETLKKTALGRLFIRIYYRLSPPIAEKLKYAKRINSLVRSILDSLVKRLNNKQP